MNTHSPSEVPPRRILPRNLTARADYLVPGNPMIARPESGVGNAHPGLEFDVRVLDRHFMPGLVFDFQYRLGAKLVHFDQKRLQCLNQHDSEQELFLWAVRGRFGDQPETLQVARLIPLDGYQVLRRIMDLERGEITVIVGLAPTTSAHFAKITDVVTALGNGTLDQLCERDGDSLIYACIHGERADYLTPDGVIDPALIEAGELSRNLCSPWQWDFAECYCYYWASSKPDIVIGISGEAQVLNFLRDRNAVAPERPATKAKSWQENTITAPAMITAWKELPIVTSEREAAVPRLLHWPQIDRPMTLSEIADELPQLARLEHALCVEYLFARYSLRTPRKAPLAIWRSALSRYRAASEIFSIAQDEMRHFRWANEALWLLERAPCLGRARVIGRDQLRLFQLRPLTPSTLDEFIGIEAPSSVFDDDPQQLNGMYTRMLVSLHQLDAKDADPDLLRRLKQLVKVIIDEGDNHWERFRRVKMHLADQQPASYLRIATSPGSPPSEILQVLQELCDAYYDILMHALYVAFWLGRLSRGSWLYIARHAMRLLDDAAFYLAEAGYGPLFTFSDEDCPVPRAFAANASAAPSRCPRFRSLSDLVETKEAVAEIFVPALQRIARLAEEPKRRWRNLAEVHAQRVRAMQAQTIAAFDLDLGSAG